MSRPSPLRSRIPLEVIRHVPVADERRGGYRDTWSAPEAITVYSIGPTASTEPGGGIVTTTLTVGMPDSYGIGPKDRIRYKGVDYAVVGDLIDANQGPWDYQPGWVMQMTRVQS